MTSGRRLGLTAALAVGPIAAWRFAQAYRARAGYPHRHAPEHDPSDVVLAFEVIAIESAGVELPGWWIPARGGEPDPAVLLVHGWESARDRTLPNALLLNALGIHVLTIDVRGHGLNPPEELPLTAGEFGADALIEIAAHAPSQQRFERARSVGPAREDGREVFGEEHRADLADRRRVERRHARDEMIERRAE